MSHARKGEGADQYQVAQQNGVSEAVDQAEGCRLHMVRHRTFMFCGAHVSGVGRRDRPPPIPFRPRSPSREAAANREPAPSRASRRAPAIRRRRTPPSANGSRTGALVSGSSAPCSRSSQLPRPPATVPKPVATRVHPAKSATRYKPAAMPKQAVASASRLRLECRRLFEATIETQRLAEMGRGRGHAKADEDDGRERDQAASMLR